MTEPGLPGGIGTLAALLGVWILAAGLAGALLAFLARRLHPELSLLKLWVFYTALVAFLAGVVFAVGWF